MWMMYIFEFSILHFLSKGKCSRAMTSHCSTKIWKVDKSASTRRHHRKALTLRSRAIVLSWATVTALHSCYVRLFLFMTHSTPCNSSLTLALISGIIGNLLYCGQMACSLLWFMCDRADIFLWLWPPVAIKIWCGLNGCVEPMPAGASVSKI